MKHFLYKSKKPLPAFFDWLILGAALTLLTVLMLPNLIGASAYFDEGYSAFLAKHDVITMAFYTALDVHPPLYYGALHVWQYFSGDSVTGLRFLSVIFAWIAVTFGFLIVRRWFGRQAAWIAVVLMALSALLIRYGATMRMYTMALAIAFSATYVLLRALESKDKKWWIIYAVLVAAGMWTNYFMALVWATHFLWLAYEKRNDKAVMRRWLSAITGAFVLYLPWLPLLIFRYGEIQVNGFWIKPISMETVASTVSQSLVFRSANDTTSWLVIAIVAFVVALSIAGRAVYKKLKPTEKPRFRMLLAMSSLPVVLLIIGSLPPFRPSFAYRYVIVAAVASTLLIGVIVASVRFTSKEQLKKAGLIALVLVVFVSGATQSVIRGNRNLDTGAQNKIGQVIDKVHGSRQPAEIITRSSYTYYAASLYTADDYPIKFVFSKDLEKIGSTKPLFDHPELSISNFDGLNKVWLVGEDKDAVTTPGSAWSERNRYTEYDDISNKPIAFAVYYERALK